MEKMGKIIMVILIFGVFFIVPAVAQVPTAVSITSSATWTRADLQSIYMEHLRLEGYLPTIDADGDIHFRVSGDNYFIIIDPNDIQFFQIYMGFSLGSTLFNDALAAANHANRRSKVAKTSISPDGRIASITVELLLNDPRDFVPVFARALSLIRNAENIYRNQLREIVQAREGS